MTKLSDDKKILIIIMLFWFSQYIYVPYTAPFLLAQKVGADVVGMVVGGYGLVQLLSRFPIGVIADIQNLHKYQIIAGLIFASSASLIRILSPDTTGFLFANLLSGLASSMWMSFIMLYTLNLGNQNLQKSMGYIYASNNLGIVVAFILSALLYEHFGMLLLCALSSIFALPAIALALTLDPKRGELKQRQKITYYLGALKNKSLWFFALIAFIHQGVLMSSAMSFSSEAMNKITDNEFLVGILPLIFILTGAISAYVCASSFVIKMGALKSIFIGMLLFGISLLLMTIFKNPYVLLFLQIPSGISCGLVFSWCNSESIRTVDIKKRSTAIGFFQSFFGGGMTIVPIIAGYLARSFNDLDYAFYFEALLCFSACALVVFFFKLTHKKV